LVLLPEWEIPIPLSGDLKKAQAKGVRHADGLHNTHVEQSKLIRSAFGSTASPAFNFSIAASAVE